MREITFRAWDEQKKVMHYNFQWMQSGTEGNDWIVFSSDKTSLDPGEVCKNPYFCQQLKKMQYTGLKDKNGKEIYEGDVVDIHFFGRSIIIYNEDICSFQYAYEAIGKGTAIGGRATNTLYKHDSGKYKIIGNIYENPELLTPCE